MSEIRRDYLYKYIERKVRERNTENERQSANKTSSRESV